MTSSHNELVIKHNNTGENKSVALNNLFEYNKYQISVFLIELLNEIV